MAKWLYSGKYVVFGQGGFIQAKVVLIRARAVVFGQTLLYSGKAVVL